MKALIALLILLSYSVILSSQERITLLFVGDLMQHQAQITAAQQPSGNYDYTSCFEAVKPMIEAADIAIGNLEVTIGGKPYTGYPTFSAPDEYLSALKRAGFDIMLTANNHCLDRGRRGLERTIRMLDSLKIPYAGTYRSATERKQRYPLHIRKNGFHIVILNYTYGTNGITPGHPSIVNYIDREQMLQDIQEAKHMRPDAIIACIHWGDEYKRLPNQSQKELADWLIKQGADHIIGAHPHVIQPMELIQKGCKKHFVAYSLGNFISNMSAPHTDGGLVVRLTLEKKAMPKPWIPSPLSLSETESSYVPLSTDTLSPICTLQSYDYSLVWTLRPSLSGQKNFRILPANASMRHLPQAAYNKLKHFTLQSNKLLKEYNVNIK